jgi:hypothetical protein
VTTGWVPVAATGAALALVAADVSPTPGRLLLVVADAPYDAVWRQALQAVADYPVEQAAEPRILTGWRARPPGTDAGFERSEERVALWVEKMGEAITRVTIRVEARGWRGGSATPIEDTEGRERAILARLRAAGRPAP